MIDLADVCFSRNALCGIGSINLVHEAISDDETHIYKHNHPKSAKHQPIISLLFLLRCVRRAFASHWLIQHFCREEKENGQRRVCKVERRR